MGAKAIGKFSKSLKLYLGIQQYIFLLSIFCLARSSQAPPGKDNKEHEEERAEQGQVCPSLEGARSEGKLERSWVSQAPRPPPPLLPDHGSSHDLRNSRTQAPPPSPPSSEGTSDALCRWTERRHSFVTREQTEE